MAINKKYHNKYKSIISVMQGLRMKDEEIENKLIEIDDLYGWEAITFLQLKSMSEEELKELKSYCWHDGKPRCQCIGIENLFFHEFNYDNKFSWKITFSDYNGDPIINTFDLTQKIDNIGDGTWNYGLYQTIK